MHQPRPGRFGRRATIDPAAFRAGASLALTVLAVLLLVPAAAPADDRPAAKGRFGAIDRGIGQTVSDFTLRNTAGKNVRLYGYAGKKAVVIVFTGTACPVNDLYFPRLEEMAAEYAPKGISFIAIDSNRDVTPAAVAAHTSALGVTFPVLMDPGNAVADTLMAERTCETLVVEGTAAKLVYRGAIDDQYTPKVRRQKPSHHYLRDALDAVLAGGDVGVKATPAEGCPIERVEAKSTPTPATKVRAVPRVEADDDKPVAVGKVTFADVAPILQRKCQECHRPGQVGPFSLLTFDQARRRAKAVREVVRERRMPPWHADPRFGHFANDRSLSPKDRAVVMAWVDQGTPEGDPAAAPKPRTFPDGWRIGTPDVVVSMKQPYLVAAQGTLPYQVFRVPSRFKEDTWVQAVEVRPGDRSVVHHILVTPVGPADRGNGNGIDGYVGLYVPGDSPSIYPDGYAKLIPAGSDLVFQIHYTPVGQAKPDLSSVGFILAKSPVKHQVVTYGIVETNFAIPPGAGDFAVTAGTTAPADYELLNFMPHMHLRGKSFTYTATYPGGKSETLLSVPAYDFAWQTLYRLTEPKKIPRGTRIECVARYDNSSANPVNPDPTRTIRWGEQTNDEMLVGYIDLILPGASPGTLQRWRDSARKPAAR